MSALHKTKDIKEKEKRDTVRIALFALIIFILTLLVIALLRIFGVINLNTQLFLVSFDVFIFNMIIVFFLNRFFNVILKKDRTEKQKFISLTSNFKITNREKDIIHLVCEGKTNKEIAEELFISPLTVRDHLSNIFKKVNVKSRVQLVNIFKSKIE